MTESLGDSIVHGLIGLLGSIVLLEFLIRWKRNREVEPGILFLLTIAAITGSGVGAVHYLLPDRTTGMIAQWSAGCLFALGICAALAAYFKRRHRDIYLADHHRPTYFKATVMKHRRHAVEGNMQMGYTAMLVLAAASLGASAFIKKNGAPVSTIESLLVANDGPPVPRTMAQLLAQVDRAPNGQPDLESDPGTDPASGLKPVAEAALEPDAPRENVGAAPQPERVNTPGPDPMGSIAESAASVSDPSPTPSPMATDSPTVDPAMRRPKNIPKNVFASHIRPILSKNCFDCHGSEKQKGGLRLDTHAGIRQGGKSGVVIVAGDPEKSPLYASTVLPADDPDIMPAKGNPLSRRDTELLRKWILFGADLGDGKHFADAASGGAGFAVDQQADGIALPQAALLEKLKTQGVHIRAVSANQALLEVDFTHLDDKATLNLKSLGSIADNIHSLDLTRSLVKNSDLAAVAAMKNLVRLQLNLTSVGDEGLAHLEGLTNLEILNLYSTQVSDAGLAHLTGLKKLQKLYLWESKATPEGADKLKSLLPKLKVIF